MNFIPTMKARPVPLVTCDFEPLKCLFLGVFLGMRTKLIEPKMRSKFIGTKVRKKAKKISSLIQYSAVWEYTRKYYKYFVLHLGNC